MVFVISIISLPETGNYELVNWVFVLLIFSILLWYDGVKFPKTSRKEDLMWLLAFILFFIFKLSVIDLALMLIALMLGKIIYYTKYKKSNPNETED